MNEIDPIVAGLNDSKQFNSKQVLELFTDLFVERGPKTLSEGFIFDYLKIKKFEGEDYSKLATKILNEISNIDMGSYSQYLRDLESEGILFAPFYSTEYPHSLWSLSDPPLCLYIDGDESSLNDGVAVVGTRSANEHRLEFAREIAHTLVKMEKTVVSGLANGVDAAAHRGALEAGGKTVAVLPGEVQKIVPAGNRELGERVRENGALVGETSSKVSIHPGRFVERNRVTSGLSTAVIIAASGETGGTIHQANFAMDQRKPRFLYNPEVDDGQSPDQLFDKGFLSFQTLDKLKQLLDSDFPHSEHSVLNSTSLDDY